MTEKYREFRKEPIKDNCIVFESLWGRKYNCNPAAFYEYICEHHPEYECVWFFNDTDVSIPGNAKIVKRKTEEYYYYLATSKYFVYNANFPVSFRKRPEQVIIQTMHGTPFKTFGLDVREELPSEKEEMRVVRRAGIWDYIVAQGRFTDEMVWRWFRYENTVLRTGYPRTDNLYKDGKEKASEIRRSIGIPDNKKVILYAPTWRSMDRFDMMLDIEKMRTGLSDEYVLLLRPHYFVESFYKVPEDGSFVFDANRVDRIDDLFPVTDILITDYSSVMFDFVLTDKPIIFYTYDLRDYTEKTRGSYFNIATEAPGTIAESTEEVIDAVRDLNLHENLNNERINSFRDKYLTFENESSSEKIFEEVFVRAVADRGVKRRQRIQWTIKKILPGRYYKKLNDRLIRRALRRSERRR